MEGTHIEGNPSRHQKTERGLEPEPAVLADVMKTGMAGMDMAERLEHLAAVRLQAHGVHGAAAGGFLGAQYVVR
jgi:hypothetical protein